MPLARTAERRSELRYDVALSAEILVDGYLYEGLTRNLSFSGVNVILDDDLPEGIQVQLTLFLTQDGIEDPSTAPFELTGTVMWTAPTEEGAWALGIRFGTLTGLQWETLANFLQQLA